MKAHLKSINKYCQVTDDYTCIWLVCHGVEKILHIQILLAKVDKSISRSLFVTNFFSPSQKDKQLPRYVSTYKGRG